VENSQINSAAEQLERWFHSVARLVDESLFSIAPEGPHHEAAVLDQLMRSARIIFKSPVDREGRLYMPLCLFLAAACHTLRITLRKGHWRAALEGVARMQSQMLKTHAESSSVGLEIGTPAVLLKQQLDEATNQAGLTGLTCLTKQNRDVALGLTVNWAIRFLLAYAFECSNLKAAPDRKDLAWVANLVRPLFSVHASPQFS